MKIRLAVPVEAEECWNIRNQAIRYGCKSSYDDAVIAAWTPEKMPESYRNAIVVNPFFVVAAPDGRLLATGYLDLSGRFMLHLAHGFMTALFCCLVSLS